MRPAKAGAGGKGVRGGLPKQPGLGGRRVCPGAGRAQGAGAASNLFLWRLLPFRLAPGPHTPGRPHLSSAHPRLPREGLEGRDWRMR